MTSADWTYCEPFGIRYEPPLDAWFEPDVPVFAGDVLRFGSIKMTAHTAPGHTPGTMAYVFDLPCGLLAAIHGGTGLNTLTSDLSVDVVLGSHPYQTSTFEKSAARTEAHNPFVDPTEWQRFLDGCQERFQQLLQNDPL